MSALSLRNTTSDPLCISSRSTSNSSLRGAGDIDESETWQLVHMALVGDSPPAQKVNSSSSLGSDVVENFKRSLLGPKARLWDVGTRADEAATLKVVVSKQRALKRIDANYSSQLRALRDKRTLLEAPRSPLNTDTNPELPPEVQAQLEDIRRQEEAVNAEWKQERSEHLLTDGECALYRTYLAKKASAEGSSEVVQARKRGAKAMQEEKALNAADRIKAEHELEAIAKQKLAEIERYEEQRQAAINELKDEVKNTRGRLSEIDMVLQGTTGPKQRLALLSEKLELQEKLGPLELRLEEAQHGEAPQLGEEEVRALRGIKAVQKMKERRKLEQQEEEQAARRAKIRRQFQHGSQGAEKEEQQLAHDKQEFESMANAYYTALKDDLAAEARQLRDRMEAIGRRFSEIKISECHDPAAAMKEKQSLLEEKAEASNRLMEIMAKQDEIKVLHEEDAKMAALTLREKEILRSEAAQKRIAEERKEAKRRAKAAKDRHGSFAVRLNSIIDVTRQSSAITFGRMHSSRRGTLTGIPTYDSEDDSTAPRQRSMRRRVVKQPSVRFAAESFRGAASLRDRSRQPAGSRRMSVAPAGGRRTSISDSEAMSPSAAPAPTPVPSAVFLAFRQALTASVRDGEPYTFDLKTALENAKERSDLEPLEAPDAHARRMSASSASSGNTSTGTAANELQPTDSFRKSLLNFSFIPEQPDDDDLGNSECQVEPQPPPQPSANRLSLPSPSEAPIRERKRKASQASTADSRRFSAGDDEIEALLATIGGNRYGIILPRDDTPDTSVTSTPVHVGPVMISMESIPLHSPQPASLCLNQTMKKRAPLLLDKERWIRTRNMARSLGVGSAYTPSTSPGGACSQLPFARPHPKYLMHAPPFPHTLLDRIEFDFDDLDSSCGDFVVQKTRSRNRVRIAV
eukprot:Sspe_Gene.50118::Locus_27643_Transcript_1_1_Confidence_1.000_Length_2831::g.50118::m.50118